MKLLLRLIFIIFALTGCHAMMLHPVPSLCSNVCLSQLNQCKIECRNNCSTCSRFEIAQAADAFKHYVYEQRMKGARVIRSLNSYRDPLQCRKTTCNCVQDFQVCHQACTGFIHKELKVPPVC